jgi:hypothetical protein
VSTYTPHSGTNHTQYFFTAVFFYCTGISSFRILIMVYLCSMWQRISQIA